MQAPMRSRQATGPLWEVSAHPSWNPAMARWGGPDVNVMSGLQYEIFDEVIIVELSRDSRPCLTSIPPYIYGFSEHWECPDKA